MIERVRFTRSADKDLRRLDHRAAQTIVASLETYAVTGVGDVKMLEGFGGVFRLRVGAYRASFTLVNKRPLVIEVVEVIKRGDAYKKKSRKRLKR